ncbi:MAG: isochorismatase family protein [Deltaproteobacteria bacterium]|nr:isochorismatase family protein [Deltaproteobacteria bacterium]
MDAMDKIRKYNIRRALPDAKKTALLVIDMQKNFAWAAGDIVRAVRRIVDTCRKREIPVIFSRHGHQHPERDGGMIERWWGHLLEYGSDPWRFLDDIQPRPDETIIEKNRYSAFHGTDLDGRLRALGIEDLVITGVLTNCCCETTARDGFMLDYRIFFVADATAAADEELHTASLINLAYGFAHVISSEELENHLSGSHREPTSR